MIVWSLECMCQLAPTLEPTYIYIYIYSRTCGSQISDMWQPTSMSTHQSPTFPSNLYPYHTHQQPSMPTHVIQIAPMYSKIITLPIISHPCPPMNNNITPMPTQNPWAWTWVWAPNVGLCYPPTYIVIIYLHECHVHLRNYCFMMSGMFTKTRTCRWIGNLATIGYKAI